MRTTYRWDKDLECLIEVGGNANFFEEKTISTSVISDDLKAGVKGLRHMPTGKMLDSKSAFREADRRVGVQCVGNEQNFASKPAPLPKGHYGQAVKQAYEQFDGNYNGIADRVRNERLRRV